MKIAQIAPPWLRVPPKNYGGTEQVLAALIEAQVAQGHDVTLFAPGDAKTSAQLVSFFPKALIEEKVPWSAHLKAYYHLSCAIETIKQDHSFDIVHTHLSSSADMYLFPLLADLSIPHLTTLHSHFPFDHTQNWSGNADECYLERWGERVPCVTISENERKLVPEGINLVGTVHNGLLMDDYPMLKRTKQEPYLVWLGRFVPEKGAHHAIEVAKRANLPLKLAGTVDRYVKEAMDYFNNTIKPQVDGKQIQYLGPVNMKQKRRLLGHAYGFLNPIEWEEPFGMVMVEAMAMGCPVISFARGAAPELIVPGKTGCLVKTRDEMVKCVEALDTFDRAEIRNHVEQNFSAHAMANNYLQVYKQVAEQMQAVAR